MPRPSSVGTRDSAASLEKRGVPPLAIVLIDVYSPEDDAALGQAWDGLMDGIYDRALSQDEDEAWMTAMPHYLSLDWQPGATAEAPTLLVRSTESMAGTVQDEAAKVTWRYARTVEVAEVPGNHFTMLETHATGTARTVDGWLSRIAGDRA
jgi:hypothetical protein